MQILKVTYKAVHTKSRSFPTTTDTGAKFKWTTELDELFEKLKQDSSMQHLFPILMKTRK